MHVVVAGGHGRVALAASRLVTARGGRVTGLIRRQEQADDVRAAGAEPVLLDLATATAEQFAERIDGADAVLYTAGAGLGDAPGRANPVDRDAALALADAARLMGVRRYVMLSSMGAGSSARYPKDPLVETYLRAKGEADEELLSRSCLDCTVLRPAWFRDGPGTGLVRLAETTGVGEVDRVDVAAVLVALLAAPMTAGRTLELVSGHTPVDEAVAALTRSADPQPGHVPAPGRRTPGRRSLPSGAVPAPDMPESGPVASG
ncbi:NAD(P)H-binding protein [Streptomyces sp. NPDC015032]|uniref:NAD(P)H-binding protein n=1 Tax=Streptomyces sp. NPDC015032 TaxID=3364937 RepID=UPI0036F9D01E